MQQVKVFSVNDGAVLNFYRMLLISQGSTGSIRSQSDLERVIEGDPELREHVAQLTDDEPSNRGHFYYATMRYIGERRRELQESEPKVEDLLRGSKRGNY